MSTAKLPYSAMQDPAVTSALAAKQGIHDQIQIANYPAGLKQFVTALSGVASGVVSIGLGGTSIALPPSCGTYAGAGLTKQHGSAGYSYAPAFGNAPNTVNGWRAQYYAGRYSCRRRGQGADGATPFTAFVGYASSISILYSQEADGGTTGVTINGVAQPPINHLSVGNVVAIVVDATGGTFTLSVGGQTTGPLSATANAQQIQTALAALSSINGNVACAPGPATDVLAYVQLTGPLATSPQAIMTANGASLTGTNPVAEVCPVYTITPLGEPTGGTYTLSCRGETTTALAYNAPAATVAAALGTLPLVGAANLRAYDNPAMVDSTTLYSTPSVTVLLVGALANSLATPITIGTSSLTGGTSPQATVTTSCGPSVGTYGCMATYALTATQLSTVVLTPATTGWSYIDGILVGPASAYPPTGINFLVSPFGGSALSDMVGTRVRQPNQAGMAASALPNGLFGAMSVWAPTNALMQCALWLWSGPTNDYASTTFTGSLGTCVTAATNNGTSVLLIMEPANALTDLSPTGWWNTWRAAAFALVAANPDGVSTFDFDYYLKVGAFASHFHATDPNNPHPGSYGYGDPHAAAGAALCALLGVPFPAVVPTRPDSIPGFASGKIVTSTTEPISVSPETIWLDTSNATAGAFGNQGEYKRKISGASVQGIWQLLASNAHPIPIAAVGVPPLVFGAWSLDTTPGGDARTQVTAALGVEVVASAMTPGAWYTLSLTVDGASASAVAGYNIALYFTGGGNFYSLQGTAFVSTGASYSYIVNGTASYRGPNRLIVTFQWPSSALLTTMAGAGITTTYAVLRFDLGAGNVPYYVSQLQLEWGASLTVGYPQPIPFVPTANNVPLRVYSATTEPAATTAGMVAGLTRWRDSSNGGAGVVKRLLLLGGVSRLDASVGTSVWATDEASQANVFGAVYAGTVIAFGAATIAQPATRSPGLVTDGSFQITTTDSGPDGVYVYVSGTLTPSAWYTLSFMLAWDYGAGGSGTLVALANVAVGSSNAINYALSSATGLYAAGQPANNYVLPLPVRTGFQKYALTFQAYTAGQAPGTNPTQWFFLRLQGATNVIVQVLDLKLELGVSVTAD